MSTSVVIFIFLELFRYQGSGIKCHAEVTGSNNVRIPTKNNLFPTSSTERQTQTVTTPEESTVEPTTVSPTDPEVLRQKMMNFTISKEKLLTKHLLEKYAQAGRGGRPIVNMSMPTNVEFGLGLIQMDLDERHKVLTTSMWTRLKWHDDYLRWDPGDYEGVTAVRLDANDVWLPDIMLYNTAEPDNAVRNALVMVFYDGTLQWVPHQIFKSSCSIDASNFPFDTQQCHMWFGSWTHSMQDIDLNLVFPGGIDLSTFQSDYKDSCEWDIVSPEADKKLLPENDTNPIAVLTFSLNLERKLVFSSYILTLPCVFLAALTLVVFWLPPDRPDRTGLAMSLFSSFLVLLLILVEAAPPTASSVPVLGVYYCFNMVIIMLSIFLSSMVVNIHRAGHNKRPVPAWVRVIVLEGLGRILFMCNRVAKNSRRNSYSIRRRSSSPRYQPGGEENMPVLNSAKHGSQNGHIFHQEPGDATNNHHGDHHSPQYISMHSMESKYFQLFNTLNEIRRSLSTMVNTTRSKDKLAAEITEVTAEWRLVANVLDRLFFMVYLVGITLSLFVLFPRPPSVAI